MPVLGGGNMCWGHAANPPHLLQYQNHHNQHIIQGRGWLKFGTSVHVLQNITVFGNKVKLNKIGLTLSKSLHAAGGR